MRGSVSPAASVPPVLVRATRIVTTAPSAGGTAVVSDVTGQRTSVPPNDVGSGDALALGGALPLDGGGVVLGADVVGVASGLDGDDVQPGTSSRASSAAVAGLTLATVPVRQYATRTASNVTPLFRATTVMVRALRDVYAQPSATLRYCRVEA